MTQGETEETGLFCLEKRRFREYKSFFHFQKKAIGKMNLNFLELCCQVEKAPGISGKKGISSWTFSHEESLCKLFIPNDVWMVFRKMIETFLLRALNVRYHLSSLFKRG